jgi:hypothetical protein
MSKSCTSVMGHKYEARYDEVPNELMNGRKMQFGHGYETHAIRELLIVRVYVQDVCVRCGDVIPRQGTK